MCVQALGSLYFIHHSVAAVEMFDFHGQWIEMLRWILESDRNYWCSMVVCLQNTDRMWRVAELLESLSLSVLTAIFPGGPGLAGTTVFPFWILLELRMMEVVVTITGAVKCVKLQSNHHHQQTNTHFFTGRMPFLSPKCPSRGGKMSHSVDLITPSWRGCLVRL